MLYACRGAAISDASGLRLAGKPRFGGTAGFTAGANPARRLGAIPWADLPQTRLLGSKVGMSPKHEGLKFWTLRSVEVKVFD